MTTESTAPQTQRVRLLVWIASLLAALGAVKFLGLLAANDFDLAKAPWAFLVVLTAPFLVAVVLLRRRPVVGAWVTAVGSLLLFTLAIRAMIRHGLHQQYWGDYLVVFLGAPLSVVGLAAAVQLIRRR